jgi:hypothetical protein
MKINITKKQYCQLVKALSLASAVTGLLGDMLERYKKESDKMHELEKYFLQYAKEFHYDEVLDGSGYDENYYESVIMPIVNDYDEQITELNLSNKLAWRDFYNDSSEEEIAKISRKNNGYFGREIYEYEKKYWYEFEKHKFNRLIISPKDEK